jgi:hypothetical protein
MALSSQPRDQENNSRPTAAKDFGCKTFPKIATKVSSLSIRELFATKLPYIYASFCEGI